MDSQKDFRSLDQLRTSLDRFDEGEQPDFVRLLKQHHDYLKESIGFLIAPDVPAADKQFHLARFLSLVAMHGKAEEETLYVALQDSDSMQARVEGFGGQDEHDLAYQLADELDEAAFEDRWNDEIAAKAKVIAGLVQNHLKEEESVMFKVAEEAIDDDALRVLALDYLDRCRVYLDEELAFARVEHADRSDASSASA